MITTVVTALVALGTLVYFFFRHKFTYWQRRGVPIVKPVIPHGNIKEVNKSQHFAEMVHEIYTKLKGQGPIAGVYFFITPVVLLLDLAAIKSAMVKDFANFQSRGVYYNEHDDPLSAHLFALDGPKWKHLRSKMTPTFTSGKMKYMYTAVVDVAERFQRCLADLTTGNDVLEMRELLARFTTDVIGTCAFGIECNSLLDPSAQFRAMGRKVFSEPRNTGARGFFILTFPDLARRLHMKNEHEDVSEFFLGIVRETVEYREKNAIRRNDFMDLLIEMKNEVPKDGSAPLTVEELAAQAYVFFLAGFETSSTTLSYALYELSINTEIQQRARDEVNTVLAKHDGKLTYEAMMEMPYIEQILYESMRKYPPVATLIRQCKNDYKFADTNATIEAGTLVLIPAYSVHHDPEHYPNPDLFDPDRFTPEAVKSRPHESFLGFGDGPRNCIGLRFGMMQARVGLITLLRTFEINTCEQSVIPLNFSKTSIVLTPAHGLYLKFRKL